MTSNGVPAAITTLHLQCGTIMDIHFYYKGKVTGYNEHLPEAASREETSGGAGCKGRGFLDAPCPGAMRLVPQIAR